MANPGQTPSSNAALDSIMATLRNGSSPSTSSPQGAMSRLPGSLFGGSNPNHQSGVSNEASTPQPTFLSRRTSDQHATPKDTSFFQPSVSSPIFSPDPHGPEPRHSSAIMSPNTQTPGAATPASSNQAANLLGLLQRNHPSHSQLGRSASSGEARLQTDFPTPHGRTVSASDLVASFLGSSFSPSSTRMPSFNEQSNAETAAAAKDTAGSDTDHLLNLLSRPKPEQGEPNFTSESLSKGRASSQAQPSLALATPVKSESSDLAKVLSSSPAESRRHEYPRSRNSSKSPAAPDVKQSAPQPPSSIFTYVNPFEALAASSPRNRTPKGEKTASQPSVIPFKIVAPTKLEGKSMAQLASTSSKSEDEQPKDSPLPNISRPLDAPLHGDDTSKESVAEALSEVGAKVNREVEEALARMAPVEPPSPTPPQNGIPKEPEIFDQVEADAVKTAAEINKELQKPENKGVLEEVLPPDVAESVKNILEKAATNDSWGTDAEDTPSNKEEDRIIRVYNLPMKPFTSIALTKPLENPRPKFHDDSIMDIAHLKKDFDQIDRTLVTATSRFIAYGMSKSGGMRIIRQDDGKPKQLFKSTHDRVFNVSISTDPSEPEGTEIIIGTSIGGSVYWAPLTNGNDHFYENENLEEHGFIMGTAFPNEEISAGVQLKTRARKSSRHPDYFAVGRGKYIYIIFPAVAASPVYQDATSVRSIDVTRYIEDRSFRIHTHKAGKDFTFSEDDTAIASLDKSGRVQIWDVRPLVDPKNGERPKSQTNPKMPSIDVRTPLMELITTASNEKSWPTSVQFVDKLRPYLKGGALRFLLVGTKQNHTIQLWDLALGKAVQELNFPHENESDAICSIAYHPHSGFVVVGHPTRNSIYFIHLSAPKYNLQHSTQADYVDRLRRREPGTHNPASTAILSGVREYSFEAKGNLRSLDLLPSQPSKDPNDPLFELYVMHSKGITCITVTREDLGWDERSKVKFPVDAETEGLITISSLKEIPQSELREPPTVPVTNKSRDVSPKPKLLWDYKPDVKSPAPSASLAQSEAVAEALANELGSGKKSDTAPRSLATNGDIAIEKMSDKTEKRRKKKSATSSVTSKDKETLLADPLAISQPPSAEPGMRSELPVRPKSYTGSQAEQSLAAALGAAKLLSPEERMRKTLLKPDDSSTIPTPGGTFDPSDSQVRRIESGVTEAIRQVIAQELSHLHRKLDDDKRIFSASSDAKHDAVLRLVSSTLSENVEKSLSRMVRMSIEQALVPSLSSSINDNLERALVETVTHTLQRHLPDHLQPLLSLTMSRILESSSFQEAIADRIGSQLSDKIGAALTAFGQGPMTKSIGNQLSAVMDRVANVPDQRVNKQLLEATRQRDEDSAKIEALTSMVKNMSQMVQALSQSHSHLSIQLEQLQKQAAASNDRPSPQSETSSSQKERPRTEAEIEQDNIHKLLVQGRLEDAIVRWLPLPPNQQHHIFDELLCKINPDALRDLSSLVTLSVAAAISSDFGKLWRPRVDWLTAILGSFTPADDSSLNDVAPGILDVIVTRLEALFMQISEDSPREPALRKIPGLARAARDLRSRYSVRR